LLLFLSIVCFVHLSFHFLFLIKFFFSFVVLIPMEFRHKTLRRTKIIRNEIVAKIQNNDNKNSGELVDEF